MEAGSGQGAGEDRVGAPGAGGHHAVPGSGRRTHLLVALLLAALTVASFVVAGRSHLPYRALAPLILTLAAVQAALQVLFYMHIRRNDKAVTLFFLAAAVLAVFIAWVVWYLLVIH